MPANVIQAGTYTLELDTGFLVDAFVLGDSLKGVLGNTEYVLGGTTQFADITEYCRTINYRRGRQSDSDQFGAGTMSFVLDDDLANGILSPYDESSPYFDPANNEPGLAPLRKVRLFRDSTAIFVGVVLNYDLDFAIGARTLVNVTCADDFYKLSQAYIDTYNVDEELSNIRVGKILDLPEVDLFTGVGERSLETSTQTLGGSAQYTIEQGTNALSYIQELQQAEAGRCFMASDGTFTWQKRIGFTLSAPVVEFSDSDNTKTQYTDVNIDFDATDVINRATVTTLAGSPQTAQDAASIAKYFVQGKNISGSQLHNNTAALDLANYLLFPNPEARYTQVTTNLALLDNTQRAAIVTADIGATISIDKTLNGTPGNLLSELSIEGIEAQIDFATGHTITFYTAPTDVRFEFIIGDPVFGILGVTDPQPILT